VAAKKRAGDTLATDGNQASIDPTSSKSLA